MSKSIFIWIGTLFFLSSCCCFTTAMMTESTFNCIQVGADVCTVKREAGRPYKIKKGDCGESYYHYVERIQIGPTRWCQKVYILTVLNGKVIGKQKTDAAGSLCLQVQ